MTEEHERQQRHAGNPEDAEARGLEFNEQADHPQTHQHRRDRIEPDRQLLRPGDVELHDLIAVRAEFLPQQVVDVLRNAGREQRARRIAIAFRRLARREREQFPLRLDDHVADLQLVILVDHRRNHLAAITLAFGNGAHAGLQVADDLELHGFVDVLPG